MAAYTLKIDHNLLNDKSYFKLTPEAKSIFLAIVTLCDADGGGVAQDDLEHILRAKNAVALRSLGELGFIEIDADRVIYPRSTLIRKETSTKKSQKRRERLAGAAPEQPLVANLVQNQPVPKTSPAFEAPKPAPLPAAVMEDDFDGWGDVEEEVAPQRQAAAPLALVDTAIADEPAGFDLSILSGPDASTAASWEVVDDIRPASVVAKPKKEPKAKLAHDAMRTALLDEGISEMLADSYFQVRKTKRAVPLNEFAWAMIKNSAEKAGWSITDALMVMVGKSWIGLDPAWLSNLTKPTAAFKAPDGLGVPDGYTKDNWGKLKKRSGGVAL
ncbi:hypothetical protein LXA47_31315 [Massilia sp. P8910]|uniref:hypothetical protein n=1 Tax=Massilia antarctica TaxID=2765360 RepID=UPI001E486E69|nr:hypothetical protein [Massilia antarctica]MCE3608061.1 hypothetical protein [Massilia antarctica]